MEEGRTPSKDELNWFVDKIMPDHPRSWEPANRRRRIEEARQAPTARDKEVEQFAKRLLGEPIIDPEELDRFAAALRGEPVIDQEGCREFLAAVLPTQEANWDPSKHPKGAFPQNRGWWSPTGGSGAAQTLASEPGKAQGISPFKTVALKAPNTTAIWKGAVIAARGRRLPTPLLDWNAKYGTTIVEGATPKFQAGRFWGATMELDELNIQRLNRIGNAGKFNPATDTTALGNVYNEAFHAWFWGNKPSLGWLLTTMNSQKQFGELLLRKAEEAMSETINQVINDLELGRPVLTYNELMQLKPSDDRRYNLTPGHNEPGQTTWGKHGAGSEKEMSEELYYATIWVLYNGNKNPAPNGGNQLAATKKFFANKFHPEWTPQQVQQFVNSRYKN